MKTALILILDALTADASSQLADALGTTPALLTPGHATDASHLITEAMTTYRTTHAEAGSYTATGDVLTDARIAATLGIPVVLASGGAAGPQRIARALDTLATQGATVAALVTAGPTPGQHCPVDVPVLEFGDAEGLAAALDAAGTPEPVIGPEKFQFDLIERARAAKAHIVLPEGDDDRILTAAHELRELGVCRLTILGDPEDITRRATEAGLNLDGIALLNPLGDDEESAGLRERFAARFAEIRASKGVTLDEARETIKDVSYYATMMISEGLADGMVSGAAHTTAHTIRPALQIIKTAPGSTVVSSIFLMVMPGTLWAFGDCAVNPNPTPAQLGEIALASARTAAGFGIDPRVAMLSYSTGASGAGPDVERVIEAVAAAREVAASLGEDLAVDGPIQFDAAVVESVGAKKMPGSDVAGRANVFVFPTLDAGNIAYKAVQRSAGALAVGPVLQGLNKPVNDLSRGATVPDIVNTVAVTAVQVGAAR